MANAIQTTVANTVFVDGAINLLQDTLAPLAVFARKFEAVELAPRTTIVVPLATTAATTQTNPTTYASGDTVVSGSSVTVNVYAQSWHISDPNAQIGLTMNHIDEINIKAFANKINDLSLAPVLSANFTAATCNLTVSASSFSATQLKSMRADIADQPIKNIVLDGTLYSQFIGTDTNSFNLEQGASIFGFDGFYENTRLDQAGLAVNGFVCSPDAIALAAGLPKRSDKMKSLVSYQVLTIPGINLPVLYEEWVDQNTRAEWRSLSVAFGAAKGNGNALRYFVAP